MTSEKRPIRVLFFIPNLEGGGAQRTIVNVLNAIDRTQFDTSLVLSDASGPYVNDLKDDISIYKLGRRRVRYSIIKLARVVREVSPDIIVSTQVHGCIGAVCAAKMAGFSGAVVLRESNHLTAKGLSTGSLKGRLLNWAYRKATRIVALSNGVEQDVENRTGIPRSKITRIYNPVDLVSIQQKCLADRSDLLVAEFGKRDAFEILGVGRLTPQKGFDVLLEALALLPRGDFRLTLIGTGPEEAELRGLAKRLDVEQFVDFVGFQSNPYVWMHHADLFVLSSRWEGFGHVIVEAMACGTPVLATRCPSGPDEIITDSRDGVLCRPEEPAEMAEKIMWLAGDNVKRQELIRNAKETMLRFDLQKIIKEYADMFLSMRCRPC